MSNWSLCLLCSIRFIFSERKCISESWRKLMNYKRVNRIPWLWQYQRFSLIVATLELVKFPCLQLWQCAALSRLRQRSCKRNHELQCFSYINAQASDYNSDSVYIASASLEWLGKYLIYWFLQHGQYVKETKWSKKGNKEVIKGCCVC